jgi:competence protein ComEC
VAWGFALAAVAAAWSVRRQSRPFWLSLGALAAFALLISLHPFAPRLPRGALEVSALDCGGGEALFVVLPDQTTLLAGACGGQSRSGRESGFEVSRWDPGEEIVSNYLWSRGVKKIDILLGTDAHLAGLAAVMRNFRVGEFWQAASSSTPAFRALLEQVRHRGVATRELRSGDLALRGDTSLRVLWSPLPTVGTAAPPNLRHPVDDESVILRIAHDKASLLISGDAGDKAEEELARSAVPLKSDVLAIASRRFRSPVETEFLARVSPRVVLWAGESGARSDGPNSRVLDQLHAAGARVFRTNAEGAVTLEMKGTQLAVRTYGTWAGEGTTAASVGATLSVP